MKYYFVILAAVSVIGILLFNYQLSSAVDRTKAEGDLALAHEETTSEILRIWYVGTSNYYQGLLQGLGASAKQTPKQQRKPVPRVHLSEI
jgi:hypothetical protein